MGTRTVRLLAVSLLTAVVAASPAMAPPDPFGPMQALRVTPPTPAPDVTLKDLDGGPVRLAMFHGRPVILTFFTTW